MMNQISFDLLPAGLENILYSYARNPLQFFENTPTGKLHDILAAFKFYQTSSHKQTAKNVASLVRSLQTKLKIYSIQPLINAQNHHPIEIQSQPLQCITPKIQIIQFDSDEQKKGKGESQPEMRAQIIQNPYKKDFAAQFPFRQQFFVKMLSGRVTHAFVDQIDTFGKIIDFQFGPHYRSQILVVDKQGRKYGLDDHVSSFLKKNNKFDIILSWRTTGG